MNCLVKRLSVSRIAGIPNIPGFSYRLDWPRPYRTTLVRARIAQDGLAEALQLEFDVVLGFSECRCEAVEGAGVKGTEIGSQAAVLECRNQMYISFY